MGSIFDEILISGYSFPKYDKKAIAFIKSISSMSGNPPTQIINPSASQLPMDVLDDTFDSYILHDIGFKEFDWQEQDK